MFFPHVEWCNPPRADDEEVLVKGNAKMAKEIISERQRNAELKKKLAHEELGIRWQPLWMLEGVIFHG